MKLYGRDVDFVSNVAITLSNKEMIKIKVVDLESLYNFVVEYFLIKLIYCFKNMLSSFYSLSAFCLALGKVLFTEGLLPSTRQRACLPSIEFQALGRVYFAECKRKKHSTKGL